MKLTKTPYAKILPTLGVFALAGPLGAAAVYVTTSDGGIWQYDSVTDMADQTGSATSGTLVNTFAEYGTDQGSTLDLVTGMAYRITGGGDVISYSGLGTFLSNTGGVTIANGLYTGGSSLNGFSYDPNAGFYGSLTGDGDIRTWATIADVIANNGTNNGAPYGGNLFNFFDPEVTETTAATPNSPNRPQGTAFDAQYYQSAGNGRLEGWLSLEEYIETPENRGEITGTNVYGGSTSAWGDGVDAVAAFAVPEPSVSLLGFLGGFALLRRRR